MTRGLRIVVAARIAATPHQAGNTWAMLQYLLGLKRLGHDVWFIDVIDPRAVTPATVPFFKAFTQQFGIEDTSTLLPAGDSAAIAGLPRSSMTGGLADADLLLNISGVIRDTALLAAARRRVYLDIDPAFTQLWQDAEGIDMGFEAHTDFVTIGVNLGRPECAVPTLGLPWHTTLQPVVLAQWPVSKGDRTNPFTTIANWRGYGSITHGGTFYGQKVHSLRELIELPSRCAERFELALAIDPAEVKDLALLARHRWNLADPARACGTTDDYQRFIRGSKAEFGVAKSGYVVSKCGWFSDRSVCYLASGRPVLAQDTGFGRTLPTGRGLFAFANIGDAVEAIGSINDDYEGHAASARGLAEEHFDSDRVLPRLLAQIDA